MLFVDDSHATDGRDDYCVYNRHWLRHYLVPVDVKLGSWNLPQFAEAMVDI